MPAIKFQPPFIEGQGQILANGAKTVYRNGAWRLVPYAMTGPTVTLALDRYDLAVETTTGVLDLSEAQSYKLVNSDAGAKTISFVNVPVDRAISVVLQIQGNAGTVSFPGGLVWPEGNPTLVNGANLFVIYYNGATFTAIQGPSA